MAVTYLEPILQGGIENPHFFNGRILTAQDLRDEQRANVTRARRLGQAIGAGVAYGLFVEAAGAALRVRSGMAVSHRGDVLVLPNESVDLALAAATPQSAGSDTPFRPCAPPGVVITDAVDAGLYLLAITGATRQEGSARTSSLNGSTAACAARYEVEGVQFKLIAIAPERFAPTGAATTLRSQLAHACFGTAELLAAAADPFSVPPRYGLIDTLRDDGSLLECDVPLAVLRWHASTVQWVDVWAVRRPCTSAAGLTAYPLPSNPSLAEEPWTQHVAPRRLAEARALLLQFQAQVDELLPQIAQRAPSLTAAAHFAYLPAAGYLPVASLNAQGLAWLRQFFALPTTPEVTPFDPAYVRALFRRSFFIDPIPVEPDAPVPVDLYTLMGADPSDPFVIFVRRQQIAVVAETPGEPPAEDTSTPPIRKKASLVVGITDPGGEPLPASAISKVVATDERGRSYTPELLDADRVERLGLQLQLAQALQASSRKRRRRSGPQGRGMIVIREPARQPAVYLFRSLEAGSYTVGALSDVTAVPVRGSVAVELGPGETEVIVLPLVPAKRGDGGKPGSAKAKVDGWLTETGHNIVDIYLDRAWKRGPRRPGEGVIDPPREWVTDPPPAVLEQVEAILAGWSLDDPRVASAGARVYLHPDYDPDAVYDQPYAYVGTADGGFYPLVLVPATGALAQDAPVTAAGVPDIDTVTYTTRLRGGALGDLSAAAYAPASLWSETLAIDAPGARALVEELRAAGAELRQGFRSYPGVDTAASQALSDRYSNSVDLANAPADEVLEVLNSTGATYSRGFALRLIERARAHVPSTAWSLDALGLNDAQRSALAELQVHTLGALRGRAADQQERAALAEALAVDDAVLERISDQAAGQIAAGRLRATPDPGVARIEGITPDLARSLVANGVGTVTALLAADPADLASRLELPEDQLNTLIERAVAVAPAAATIAGVPGAEDAGTRTALEREGIRTAAELARVDAERLAGIVGDARLAERLRVNAGVIAGSLRFRP